MHSIPDACDLSPVEQELLRAAAANRGALHVESRADTRGRAVRAGKRNFYDASDRNFAQTYVSAIPQLEHLQLIREGASKGRYELTNFGWQLTRKLERPQESSPAAEL